MTLDQVRIDDIVVGERARRDYGDLTDLMESIREHGMLQPIGLAPGNHLLFGGRRLEAMKRLGETVINVTRPATQTDALSLLKAERDENTCRKDMTAEELVDVGLRIAEMERPKARERQSEGGRSGAAARWDGFASPEANPEAENSTQRTTDYKVAEALGVSRPTYQRMKHVVQTARDENEEPEVRQIATEALTKLNAGEIRPTTAERLVRETRKETEPKPKEANLTRPQPPAYGPRRKHAEVIEKMTISLSGLAMAAEEITELDQTVTTEKAAQLVDDLTASIRSLNRLKQSLTRKATS